MFFQPRQHRLFVMLANIGRHTRQKLFARDGLGHLTDITLRQLHKIICDDDSVLAFLFGVLRDECLLENYHF